MSSAALKLKAKVVYQEYGDLVAVSPAGLCVRVALGDLVARRAVSCLVEPRPGDRVLVATEEAGESYVLAVLDRGEDAPTTLSVEGDLELRSARGKVSVVAPEGVEVTTAAPLRITAAAVDVCAVAARVATQALEIFGAKVNAELSQVKLLAQSVDSELDRWSQRVKRSYRKVEEIDHLRAEQIDYAARGNARVHGENALVTGEDLVKINADQVHLG